MPRSQHAQDSATARRIRDAQPSLRGRRGKHASSGKRARSATTRAIAVVCAALWFSRVLTFALSGRRRRSALERAVRPRSSKNQLGAEKRCDCRGCRSEEHTSELQSRLHLVCRLLLEKKKK